MKHEIFGWSFDHEPKKLDDLFDCIRDADDEVIFATKKTYEYREDGEDGLKFNYKLVIRAENAYELTGEPEDEDMWHLEVMLVPTVDSLLPNKREDTLDGEDCTLIDLIDAGSYVQFAFEAVKVDPDKGYDAIMNPKYDEVASIIENINALRDFYLDRPFNRIGSTGRDILNSFVGNGKDFISAAFDRMK